jgi:hypothetical protein
MDSSHSVGFVTAEDTLEQDFPGFSSFAVVYHSYHQRDSCYNVTNNQQ